MDSRAQQAYNSRIKYLEKSITKAGRAVAGTEVVDFDSALPADAVVVGAYINVTEAWDDGAAGTFVGDVGLKTVDTDGFIDGAADNLGTTGRKGQPRGVLMGCFVGGESVLIPCIALASNVNLSTATTGALTARVYYYQADKVSK